MVILDDYLSELESIIYDSLCDVGYDEVDFSLVSTYTPKGYKLSFCDEDIDESEILRILDETVTGSLQGSKLYIHDYLDRLLGCIND